MFTGHTLFSLLTKYPANGSEIFACCVARKFIHRFYRQNAPPTFYFAEKKVIAKVTERSIKTHKKKAFRIKETPFHGRSEPIQRF